METVGNDDERRARGRQQTRWINQDKNKTNWGTVTTALSQVTALADKYQDREDFAVVVQPFFKNSVLPVDKNGDVDISFFSVDCFHFTERGQSEMAKALWNSMDKPYLFTLKNSGLPEPPETVVPVPEEEEGQVPYWSVIVGTIGGCAVGCAIVGIAMSMTYKKKMRKMRSLTQSNSSF
ncbi:hypothetical protein XENTR_v10013166 [Xenopus tropicalis]|nr:hypothetical protein XENTR_v10013166 [Xenopus tropicalis]